MNFLGVGMPEMGVILLVAFLVLGPNRAIEMAKTAGKVVRDLRRTFNEIMAAANLDQLDQVSGRRDYPRANLERPGHAAGTPDHPPVNTEQPEQPDSLPAGEAEPGHAAGHAAGHAPPPDREESPPSKTGHE